MLHIRVGQPLLRSISPFEPSGAVGLLSGGRTVPACNDWSLSTPHGFAGHFPPTGFGGFSDGAPE